MVIARRRKKVTETFQYVATPVHVLTWRHKPLYTLNLTQTKKIITNLSPEFLTLIIIYKLVGLGLGLGILDSPSNLTQRGVSVTFFAPPSNYLRASNML